MKTLNKEELKFIDNYLLKADVIYKDIRVEMVDHVANAVEERMTLNNEDFYDAFKTYMVNHKKELINNDKQFIKTIRNSIFKQILKNIVSVKSLLVFIIAFFFQLKLNHKFLFLENENFFSYYGVSMLICFFITKYLTIFFPKSKVRFNEKFSAVTILASILVISYYILKFLLIILNRIFDDVIIIAFLSFFMVVLFSYYIVLHTYINKYKNQFSN
jgi:hypothetical protein